MYGPKDIPSMGHHTERLLLSDWAVKDKPGSYTIAVWRTLNLIPKTRRWTGECPLTIFQQ
jgi:hypothetical protein